MGFIAVVLYCFNSDEYLKNWERLRGLKCDNPKAMLRFIKDVKDLVWDRIPHREKAPP